MEYSSTTSERYEFCVRDFHHQYFNLFSKHKGMFTLSDKFLKKNWWWKFLICVYSSNACLNIYFFKINVLFFSLQIWCAMKKFVNEIFHLLFGEWKVVKIIIFFVNVKPNRIPVTGISLEVIEKIKNDDGLNK